MSIIGAMVVDQDKDIVARFVAFVYAASGNNKNFKVV